MGLHMFLQLFGMACKLPVALNTDMRSVAFQLFNLYYFILFLTPYFVVSEMVAYNRMEQILFFFRS